MNVQQGWERYAISRWGADYKNSAFPQEMKIMEQAFKSGWNARKKEERHAPKSL